MKLYNVYVYNTRDNYHDCYMVNAVDPVDARGVAVQRLIDETGEGLNAWEIIGVKSVLSSMYGKRFERSNNHEKDNAVGSPELEEVL